MARRLIGMAAGLLALVSLGGAGGAGTEGTEGLGERLGAVIDRASLGQFWGVVLVRVGDGDVLRRGYGLEGDSLEPIDPGASLFDVGSVSKSVTAAAVLRMVEDGDLMLATTLGEVFVGADLGVFGDTTVEELLGHRWGLRDPGAAMHGADFSQREAVTDVLRFARRDGRRGDFGYSNFGYFVLAAVIETRGGAVFEDAVRARVLGPAGLATSGFVGDGSIEGGRATARVSGSGGERAETRSDVFGYPWNWGQRGATGVVMTGDDAARWIGAVCDGAAPGGGVLGAASRAAMLEGGAGGYGLGVYAERGPDGAIGRVWHGGATGGYRCVVERYPAARGGAGVTIVVLTNERWDPRDLAGRLARVVMPPEPKPSRASVHMYRYEPVGGVVEVAEGLSWSVMPSYRGRDADGRAIIEDRPTVVTVDAGVSMWTTMVMLDRADALAMARDADAAARAVEDGVDEAAEAGSMSMRFDVSGVELGAFKDVTMAPGSGWTFSGEGGWVVARLADRGSGRVLAEARMSVGEARGLGASLRTAAE